MWVCYGKDCGAFDHWVIEPSADFWILWGSMAAFFAALFLMGLAERAGWNVTGWDWIFLSVVSFAILMLLKGHIQMTPAEDWWFVTAFPLFFVLMIQCDLLLSGRRMDRDLQGIVPGGEGGEAGRQGGAKRRRGAAQT